MSRRTLALLLLLAAGLAAALLLARPQGRAALTGGGRADTATAADPAAGQEAELPAGAATALQRLDRSPRHGEYAMVPVGDGDSVRAWVVYPERSDRAPVVLVVHEIYGLTHWIRAVADQLAAEGFIAIAPDLLTAHAPPAGADGDPVQEQAVQAIRTLEPARYQQQLARTGEWGMQLPAATQRYGILGFCWGGAAAFAHAAAAPRVAAAVVFYGSAPPPGELAAVRAPVLGLFAGDDARVNATVEPARGEMRRLGRTFDAHFFDGAGHGFLRQQDGRDGANAAASRTAWPLALRFLRQHLE